MIVLPRRILVVGATGHTGERLALRLARLGVRVRALTRKPDGEIGRRLKGAGIEVVEGDALRRWTLWDAMEGMEAVASCAHIRYAEALVQGCLRSGVERLVVMSSTRRFSTVRDTTAVTVAQAEAEVTQSVLDWTILRPTMIFGGRRDANLERVLLWLRRHSWFPLVGNGRNLVQPVFVEDLVDAFVEALRQSGTARREFNLAGPEPMEYAAMIRQLADLLDRPVRLVHFPRPVALTLAGAARHVVRGLHPDMVRRMGENKTFDISEARRVLNFRPRPFAEAAAAKVAGHAEVESLYPAVRGAESTEEE